MAFNRGDRIYHTSRGEHGTYVEPATRETALVVLDSGRVDGNATTDPHSLDTVEEVSIDRLEVV